MTPKNAKKELETRIKKFGRPMGSLTPADGIRLMLDFYRDVRADGCELDEDGDMVLFQWGTYDFDKGRSFQFDITRQFTVAEPEDEDDDSAMSQLSFTFHFTPSPECDALKDGNQWCSTPDDLEEFESFITDSDAYAVLLHPSPRGSPWSMVGSETRSNNRVERTAAMRFGFDGDGLQTAVVAVVSTLPAAVAHPCR